MSPRSYREIMAEELGRPLTPDEVVHHKDGDSRNNAPENLMVFPNHAEHSKHHRDYSLRPVPQWQEPDADACRMLADLLSGPYAIRGGRFLLAKAVGVTRLTLTKWQNGTMNPSHSHWQAITALWQAHREGAQA